MESRTYRQSSCGLLAGGIITSISAIGIGLTAYHLATGIPLMQGGSKFSPGEHVANRSELWFGLFGSLPFFVFGLVFVLTCLNSAVTTDDEGISATNLLRRRFFAAKWSEITSFERVDPGPGSGYKLVANGKTLKIQTSAANLKDLLAEIKRRVPAAGKP